MLNCLASFAIGARKAHTRGGREVLTAEHTRDFKILHKTTYELKLKNVIL